MRHEALAWLGVLGGIVGLCTGCKTETLSLGEEEGGPSWLPYPAHPSTPLDPECTCQDPDQICSGEGHCVPRCDAEGRCAMWLVDDRVSEFYLDGSTLYFSAATDLLDQDNVRWGLYRVTYPDGDVERIALSSTHEFWNLYGRFDGRSYVWTNSDSNSPWEGVAAISDNGAVTDLGIESLTRPRFEGRYLLFDRDMDRDETSYPPRLWRVDLSSDPTPALLFDSAVLGDPNFSFEDYFAGERLWMALYSSRTASSHLCVADFPDTSQDFTCAPNPMPTDLALLGEEQGQLLVALESEGLVVALAEDASVQRVLLDQGPDLMVKPYRSVRRPGWVYMPVASQNAEAGGEGRYAGFVRFPTRVRREPQDLIPPDMALAMGFYNSVFPYAVGKTGIFWQGPDVLPYSGPKYIFHAPLPPEPCDEEVLCEDPDTVCKSGLCQPRE